MEGIPVNELVVEPYLTVLGYPHATPDCIESILEDMTGLGVRAVSFVGETRLNGVNVLGKGVAGVVVLVHTPHGQAALKIRRSDSPRDSMYEEGSHLGYANRFGIGPRLMGQTRECIVMEYLRGTDIGLWLRGLGTDDEDTLKDVMRTILYDCHTLDRANLDHGEVGHISRHVIVGERATIVDFESASRHRRATNVLAATQGLYLGGLSRYVDRVYKIPPRNKTIQVLQEHKKRHTNESFEEILRVLHLI